MGSNTFGERYLGKVVAWHKLGDTFTGEITAKEAVNRCKLDYQAVLCPLMADVSTIFGQGVVPVEGRMAIVREPTPDDNVHRIFGLAGEGYSIVQNTDLAGMLDQYIPEFKVETVGALGRGETVFYCLRIPESVEVAGDEIYQYFVVTDTKDGKTALRIVFTPVRVVCQNTLVSGLRQATVKAALPHGPTMFSDLDFRLGLLGKLQAAQDMTMAAFRQLAEVAIRMPVVDHILELTYPVPSKPVKVELLDESPELFDGQIEIKEALSDVNRQWEYYCNLAQARRDEAKERLVKLNDEFPVIARTPWAVYNAVVENEDHRDGPESMYASAVFGERARTKARAFNAAMAYIK